MSSIFELNFFTILSSFLSTIYLLRVAKHIALRSSYYIAPIIILPFLTSIYKQTFLDFLLNPNIDSPSLEGIKNLFQFWFNGSPAVLVLLGLFFIAEKVSLISLGLEVIEEVLLIAFGASILLIKFMGFLYSFPILLGIFVGILIHIFKKKEIIFDDSGLLLFRNYIFKNRYSEINYRLIFGLLYLIVCFFIPVSNTNILFLSSSRLKNYYFLASFYCTFNIIQKI